MLINVFYKESSVPKQLLISGASMASALVYCDANNIIPTSLNEIVNSLMPNNTSLNYNFNVTLKDQSENVSNQIIFDTFDNVISWVNSQSGKYLVNLTRNNQSFVTA
jgi:hypothetical protein